ncbi:MAG: PAS domain-containing sensor histidine kinase [Nitrospinota bacterium]|nr:PAS domain-containing sensor histidine kinase [Nitrospinota bacterium]
MNIGQKALNKKEVPPAYAQTLSGSLLAALAEMAAAGALAVAAAAFPVKAPVIAGWLVLVAGAAILRVYYSSKFGRLALLGEGLALWSRAFVLLMLARGAAWGAGGWLLFPQEFPAGQALLLLFIAAIVAQTTMSISPLRMESAAFAVPSLLPISFLLLQTGGYQGYSLAAVGWGICGLSIYLAGTGAAGGATGGESASLYKKLMEQAGESMFVIDSATGVFLDVNSAACRALGYTRQELLAMRVEQVETRFNGDMHWDSHVQEVSKKGSDYMPGAHKRKDGTIFPVEVNVQHLLLDGREYIVALARDVSEWKNVMDKLGENEKQLTTILESIPLSIMILDDKGLVKYLNLGFMDWYGVFLEQASGKPEPDIWADPADREKFYSLLDRRGYVADFEASHKGQGGAWQWAMVSGVKIILKGEPVTMVTRRDITPLKEAEKSLRAAKIQAEEATELKDQFVSLVSHDLRSPLGSIQGLLRLLRGQWSQRGEKGPEIIDKVIGASDMMVTMVDQLLDISRLKTGKIVPQKERFSARNFLDDCTESVSYLAEKKGIVITNDVSREMFVEADRALLAEVVNNLLSNAVKFCSAGQRITLLSPEDKPGALAVRDNGTGMDDYTRNNIFKHEVKTTTVGTAGEKGTGLGLPYCHDIMKAHGGSLTVESEKGKGTTFYITLPEVRQADTPA